MLDLWKKPLHNGSVCVCSLAAGLVTRDGPCAFPVLQLLLCTFVCYSLRVVFRPFFLSSPPCHPEHPFFFFVMTSLAACIAYEGGKPSISSLPLSDCFMSDSCAIIERIFCLGEVASCKSSSSASSACPCDSCRDICCWADGCVGLFRYVQLVPAVNRVSV